MMEEYNQRNIFVIVRLSFPLIDSSQKMDGFALSIFDEWKVPKSSLFLFSSQKDSLIEPETETSNLSWKKDE